MGLIRVALGAVGGVIADQYKEYFICDALPDNVLVRRATPTEKPATTARRTSSPTAR